MLNIVDSETALPLDGLDHCSEEWHVPPGVGLQLNIS